MLMAIEDFNLPAVSQGLPTRCVFSLADVASAVRFEARPLDSFGNKGEWVSAETRTLDWL